MAAECPLLPAVAWRGEWLARLEATPPWLFAWLRHQTDGPYWRQGSLAPDYDAIDVPIFSIGGWHDSYVDPAFRMHERCPAPSHTLVGNWVHSWPHSAYPGPNLDELHEIARFFDRHLNAVTNGWEDEPAVVWFEHEYMPPVPFPPVLPGRWRATSSFPHPATTVRSWAFGAGALAEGDIDLWIKDESINPTQSFKARGMTVAVSMAKHLGATKLAVPSAGNAGGALAAYAARAGLEAHIFMPRDTPRANIIECRELGAHVTLINGLITDCGGEIARRKAKEGWFDMSTLKEPYRLEGKKTMGLELAEQLDQFGGGRGGIPVDATTGNRVWDKTYGDVRAGESATVAPAVNQVQFSPFQFRRRLLDACRRIGMEG